MDVKIIFKQQTAASTASLMREGKQMNNNEQEEHIMCLSFAS